MLLLLIEIETLALWKLVVAQLRGVIRLSDILDDHLATIGSLDLLGHHFRIEWVLRSALDSFRGNCWLV